MSRSPCTLQFFFVLGVLLGGLRERSSAGWPRWRGGGDDDGAVHGWVTGWTGLGWDGMVLLEMECSVFIEILATSCCCCCVWGSCGCSGGLRERAAVVYEIASLAAVVGLMLAVTWGLRIDSIALLSVGVVVPPSQV